MKNQILFINQSPGYLMVDIIRAFEGIYEERVLVAGSVSERNHALGPEVKRERIIAYDRSSTFKRLFTWAWGFLQIVWLVWTKYPKAHLFLVSNPPFAPLTPLFCRNRFSVLVYDIYPDALVEYKVLKPRTWPVRLWEWANRKVYQRAQFVFTITQSMAQRLKPYVGAKSVQVVPVWSDTEFLQPIPKAENPFIRQQGLENQFVVLYSGNLGRTHEVEVLVDLAAHMQEQDVFFLIIGGGEKQSLIEDKIAEYGLGNCRFLPWQPVEMLPYTLAAADIGVVSLGKEAATLSIPSKTFSLLAVGAPLLCLAEPESELGQLVDSLQVGKNFQLTQLTAMADFIQALRNDPQLHEQFSKRAIHAAAKFTPANAQQFVKNQPVYTVKK